MDKNVFLNIWGIVFLLIKVLEMFQNKLQMKEYILIPIFYFSVMLKVVWYVDSEKM